MQNPWQVTREDMLQDPRFKEVKIYSTVVDLQQAIAREMADLIKEHNARGEMTRFILPVGPLDYKMLAKICKEETISCRNVVVFNMDEVLTPEGEVIPYENPFSFRRYMDREFYNLLPDELNVLPENRIFPDPHDLGAIERKMQAVGGVDVCYGGFGIVGHFAYNEPVSEDELQGRSYAELPTRITRLTTETIVQAAMSSDGDLDNMPRRAITIGMKEILASRVIHLCFMRTWQTVIVRKALYGPMTPACPASYLQLHPNLHISMIEAVAARPELIPG